MDSPYNQWQITVWSIRMHAKTNRQNHDFQIAYFLAGSCHTADGAYALLCDLLADRQLALDNYEANQFRQRAKRIQADRLLKSDDELDVLEGQAMLREMEAFADMEEKNVAGARAEVEFIQKCIEKLQPFRKYAHLPDAKAHEAVQQEEWKLELLGRAQNYLLTVGHIPTDQFATMRQHPEFHDVIYPAVAEMRHLLSIKGGEARLLAKPIGYQLPDMSDD